MVRWIGYDVSRSPRRDRADFDDCHDLSFFFYSSGAAKTNNRTSDINRATFIAQAHLETLNQYTSYSEIEKEDLRFDQEGFSIETEISGPTDNTTTLYLTKVTVTKGGKAYAEMQTYLTLTTPPK